MFQAPESNFIIIWCAYQKYCTNSEKLHTKVPMSNMWLILHLDSNDELGELNMEGRIW